MAIISETVLESNKKIRVNFDGGNLSSDGGLLLLKEFYHKLGVNSLLRNRFRTTDTASFRIHKDHENLLQMLYQITGAYFQDDHADSLRNDPVLNAVIGKTALASQPTLSRFHNRTLSLLCPVFTTAWMNGVYSSWKRYSGFFAEESILSINRSTFCSTSIPPCWLHMARRKAKRSTTTTKPTVIIPCFASTE